MKRNNKRKMILVSLVSVLVCGALLAASSFAWFTDKVTNEDNTIDTGKFDLNGMVIDITKITNNGLYDTLDATGRYHPVNLEKGLVIESTNWEPGQSDAKLIQLHNNGTLAMDVKMEFDGSGNLSDALWFSVYQYKDIDTDSDGGADACKITSNIVEKGTLADLQAALKTYSIRLLRDQFNAAGNGQYVEESCGGFILEYGMNENAGNEYQNKNFTATITFDAKQATVEKDGFGSDQYDVNAEYDDNVAANKVLIAKGGTIDLAADMKVSDEVSTVSGGKVANHTPITSDLVINGNGNEIDMNGTFFYATGACTKIVIKDATIVNTPLWSALVDVHELSNVDVVLENVTFVDPNYRTFFVNANTGTVSIKDCTFTAYSGYTPANGAVLNGGGAIVTVENSTINGTAITK